MLALQARRLLWVIRFISGGDLHVLCVVWISDSGAWCLHCRFRHTIVDVACILLLHRSHNGWVVDVCMHQGVLLYVQVLVYQMVKQTNMQHVDEHSVVKRIRVYPIVPRARGKEGGYPIVESVLCGRLPCVLFLLLLHANLVPFVLSCCTDRRWSKQVSRTSVEFIVWVGGVASSSFSV